MVRSTAAYVKEEHEAERAREGKICCIWRALSLARVEN